MDTSKDIRERIEEILRECDRPEDFYFDKATDSILQVFKEYIEEQETYSTFETDGGLEKSRIGNWISKSRLLEGLEKENGK